MDLQPVITELKLMRSVKDPLVTRAVNDYHYFYKTAMRLVRQAMPGASEEEVVAETIRVFRAVLELDANAPEANTFVYDSKSIGL